MAKTPQIVTLSPSRDIPFDKLVLSQSNVRRLGADLWVEELAEDIARRGLLQSLNVRHVLDAEGVETGIRNPGRWPTLPGAVVAGEAETAG